MARFECCTVGTHDMHAMAIDDCSARVDAGVRRSGFVNILGRACVDCTVLCLRMVFFNARTLVVIIARVLNDELYGTHGTSMCVRQGDTLSLKEFDDRNLF